MERYYRSFSSYLKERFGEKVYRVSLDAGFTCPNRDGTLGYSGCAYCAGAASWASATEASASRISLGAQVERGKEKARRKHGARRFIAYFQAYTGTYGPVDRLKAVYGSVLDGDEEFVALAVGTRPDCVDAGKLELLASYIGRGLEVWVEYGLQTARDETLALIGRKPDVVRTAETLGDLAVEGVKIHNLNILEGTRMAEWHAQGMVAPLGLREYASLTVDFLERLPPETVVERLVTDSDPRLLLAPRWSLNKRQVLEEIRGEFTRRGSRQGKLRRGE
jgi:radical SAM superfamily enzyme